MFFFAASVRRRSTRVTPPQAGDLKALAALVSREAEEVVSDLLGGVIPVANRRHQCPGEGCRGCTSTVFTGCNVANGLKQGFCRKFVFGAVFGQVLDHGAAAQDGLDVHVRAPALESIRLDWEGVHERVVACWLVADVTWPAAYIGKVGASS